jgi:hypothetical protein
MAGYGSDPPEDQANNSARQVGRDTGDGSTGGGNAQPPVQEPAGY